MWQFVQCGTTSLAPGRHCHVADRRTRRACGRESGRQQQQQRRTTLWILALGCFNSIKRDERDGRAQMTVKIERFQPEGMNVRISNGQPSYSHVVTVSVTRLAGPDFMVEIEAVAVVNS